MWCGNRMSPLPTTGTGNRGCHLPNRVPVGRLTIPGIAGAPVHDHRVGAAVHGGPGLLDEVAVGIVPPEPDLCGDGHRCDRALHGFHDPPDALGLPAEGRAHSLPCEMIDTATRNWDVYQVRHPGFHEGGRPAHLLGVSARELHAENGSSDARRINAKLAAPLLLEPAGYGHLAHQHRAPSSAQSRR